LTSRTRARAQLDHVLDVALGPAEIRLQDDADLPVVLLPEGFEDLECGARVRRALHVDADEEAFGAIEDAAQVVGGDGAIQIQAEL
jgi:hypothetical protein